MCDSIPSCLVGIDGGGTSCRFALTMGGQRHELTLGAANATTDRDATVAVLTDGIARLADRAGLSGKDLERMRLHAGLAGIMTDADAADIAARLPLRHARVTDDRPTSLAGALGGSDGYLAAIGTGSFFAHQSGLQRRFIGGWGLVLGDEASGAWLGRALLSATLHATDGLREHTALTRATLDRSGGSSGIVSFARTARPSDFATLAADIVSATDDPVAIDLMGQGAAFIRCALTALGWTPGDPLCLIGGIGPHYGRYLDAPTLPPKGSALDGALALAAEIPVTEVAG